LAALPFRYLGVLIAEDGAATVTGRLELNGGTLNRHLRALHVAGGHTSWHIAVGSRWGDPVMRSLADPTNALVGAPHALTHRVARLARIANHGRTAFISVGHARTWWRGQPPTPAAAEGLLVKDVVAAFTAVH
jgi:hypothetical protein